MSLHAYIHIYDFFSQPHRVQSDSPPKTLKSQNWLLSRLLSRRFHQIVDSPEARSKIKWAHNTKIRPSVSRFFLILFKVLRNVSAASNYINFSMSVLVLGFTNVIIYNKFLMRITYNLPVVAYFTCCGGSGGGEPTNKPSQDHLVGRHSFVGVTSSASPFMLAVFLLLSILLSFSIIIFLLLSSSLSFRGVPTNMHRYASQSVKTIYWYKVSGGWAG